MYFLGRKTKCANIFANVLLKVFWFRLYFPPYLANICCIHTWDSPGLARNSADLKSLRVYLGKHTHKQTTAQCKEAMMYVSVMFAFLLYLPSKIHGSHFSLKSLIDSCSLCLLNFLLMASWFFFLHWSQTNWDISPCLLGEVRGRGTEYGPGHTTFWPQ